MDTNTTVTTLINKEIDDLKIPLTSVAENSGISYSTLSRRVKGGGEWTATEILRVANALRTSPGKLLPAEFMQPMAVAS